MPLISTNDIPLHRKLKSKAAELGLSLGKLVDIYLKAGLRFGLENRENVEKVEKTLQESVKEN